MALHWRLQRYFLKTLLSTTMTSSYHKPVLPLLRNSKFEPDCTTWPKTTQKMPLSGQDGYTIEPFLGFITKFPSQTSLSLHPIKFFFNQSGFVDRYEANLAKQQEALKAASLGKGNKMPQTIEIVKCSTWHFEFGQLLNQPKQPLLIALKPGLANFLLETYILRAFPDYKKFFNTEFGKFSLGVFCNIAVLLFSQKAKDIKDFATTNKNKDDAWVTLHFSGIKIYDRGELHFDVNYTNEKDAQATRWYDVCSMLRKQILNSIPTIPLSDSLLNFHLFKTYIVYTLLKSRQFVEEANPAHHRMYEAMETLIEQIWQACGSSFPLPASSSSDHLATNHQDAPPPPPPPPATDTNEPDELGTPDHQPWHRKLSLASWDLLIKTPAFLGSCAEHFKRFIHIVVSGCYWTIKSIFYLIHKIFVFLFYATPSRAEKSKLPQNIKFEFGNDLKWDIPKWHANPIAINPADATPYLRPPISMETTQPTTIGLSQIQCEGTLKDLDRWHYSNNLNKLAEYVLNEQLKLLLGQIHRQEELAKLAPNYLDTIKTKFVRVGHFEIDLPTPTVNGFETKLLSKIQLVFSPALRLHIDDELLTDFTYLGKIHQRVTNVYQWIKNIATRNTYCNKPVWVQEIVNLTIEQKPVNQRGYLEISSKSLFKTGALWVFPIELPTMFMVQLKTFLLQLEHSFPGIIKEQLFSDIYELMTLLCRTQPNIPRDLQLLMRPFLRSMAQSLMGKHQ